MATIAIPVLNRPVDATVEVPLSKSITNRALLVAVLAPSDSILENALFSKDWHLLSTGLKVPGIVIKDPGCTAKTFPDYFTRFFQMLEQ